MRKLAGFIAAAVMTLAVPAASYAQGGGQIQGFAGLTLRDFSPSTTAGGSVAMRVTDNVQIFAEGGRLSNITWAPLAELINLSPVDARVSANYGEAGLRILASSNRAVRPYAEASAGFARLNLGLNGIGDTTDPIVNAALGLFDTTQPMYGVGAGVLVQGGPVVLDLGYRLHRIRAGNTVQRALTGGDLTVQQLRLGIGFKF